MATALTEYAKQRAGTPEGELEQSYRNSIYCAGVIKQEGGVLTSRYCGNRWCLSCNRIRMGKAINTYGPVLREWEDGQFVTLTVQNPPGDELRGVLEGMQRAFKQAVRKVRRLGFEVQALRKTECTHNLQREDYHPHYHVSIDGEGAGRALIDAWLKFAPKYTGRPADPRGQDIRPLDATDEGLKELFKYFQKLTAKTGNGPGRRAYVGPAQLDVMFRSMRGLRVYQPYGFRVGPDANDVEELDAATVAISREDEDALWLWDENVTDWVDHETGECLTGHAPDAKASRFAGYFTASAAGPVERGPP